MQTRFGSSVVVFLFAVAQVSGIGSSRVAHVFSQDEDIVLNTTVTGTANYTITHSFYNETVTGSVPVVGGVVRIPAYGLTCGPCTFSIAGDGTLNGAIVPGVIRYSDHLVSPVWQHQRPTPSTQHAAQAYMLFQLGFGGTNLGDVNYTTPINNDFMTFQAAMCALGLYVQGKEGWNSQCSVTQTQIENWTQELINRGGVRMAMTLGNEPEAGGFWSCSPTAPTYRDYQIKAYNGIKARMPDAIVGGPDAVLCDTYAWFWDVFFDAATGARNHCDYFSYHQTAMGVDTSNGTNEGDIHTWVRRMKSYGVSKPMADGEVMCGSQGGLEYCAQGTYWHMNGHLGSWPTVESAIIGAYVRGCVRTDIFNPSYEGQPLWNGRVNPYRDLTTKALACRPLSDWLSGSFPLGRIDVHDYRTDRVYVPRTEVWATKRGSKVGLWMWTNERTPEANPIQLRVEIKTVPNLLLEVIDNQGNVYLARADANGIVRYRIMPIAVFMYGFPDIPMVTPVNFQNQTPQINTVPVTEAAVGVPYRYQVRGYDAEEYSYQWNRRQANYSLTTAPSGMTITNFGGLIRWTPAAGQTGNQNVVVRYQDPDGASTTQSFTITVKPAGENVGPYFVSNPPRVAPINKQYFYAPKAVDPNGDAVTYSLVSGPAGMAFAGSTLTWTPTASMGTEVTIQASDGRGGVATQTWDLASGVVAIRTRGGWPNAPGNLTGTPGAGTSVVLSWQDNSSGDREEKGFVVERSSVAPPGDINLRFGTSCYVDNRPFVMVHVTEANETTWTDTPPQAGTYWYRVKAVNHIADWGGYSNIVQVTAGGGGANQPPVITLTSPANGSTYGAPANITLAATATDPDGNVQGVTFWSGGTLLNTDNASPWTYTWANVSSGTYQLRAVAQDNLGATSTSAVVNVTVTWTPPGNSSPTVSIVSPVTGSTFTTGSDITIAATASDSDGSIAAVRFYSGTTLLGTDSTSPYSYTWVNVAAGSYALTAQAQDNEGAVRTSAVVNITVSTPNQPPVVSLTSPVNNSTYTAPADIALAATATDPDGSIAHVRFYRGSTLLNTDSASPYEYTWTNVSSGTYQLRAVAQDTQGATSTSTIITVTVLSSSTPAVWYTLTATANPANGGTISPASGTYLAGSQIQVTATPNANYTFATWSGNASGTNPTVTITMDADKTLTANFTYTPPVNSSPSVTITSPADGATFTAPASITITATATDSDGSIAAVRFYHGTTLLATDSTSPYSYTWTGVPAGSYILTAQAQDNQGAVGTSTAIGITVSAQAVYYTLTVNANPSHGGTITQSPTGSSHLAGTPVTVTATPSAGYEFAGWSGDITGSSTTNPMVVVMDGNKNITANFREVQIPQPVQPSLTPGEVRIVGGLDGYINATTNPNVTIRFRRTSAGIVTMKVFDLRGRLVVEKNKDGVAGIDDDIAWNVADLPAGVYIVRIMGGGVSHTQKTAIFK
jgi:uncharacterized repeat protein (TIGR02543 family)